jgi:DNA modification methylase
MSLVRILNGDCRDVLKTLPDQSVNCCVTSPPYFGLRDYGHARQIGLEATPDAFVAEMVAVFREVRRVLRDDGTLWLNLGDSYSGSGRGGNPDGGTKQGTNKGSQTVGVLYGLENQERDTERQRMKAQNEALRVSGLKPKDLIGIPWRVAFALQADGWYLRQDIIWHKPNPMPESVTDRCTKAHEYIFMLSKSKTYQYDAAAISEDAIYSGLANQDASGFKDPRSFDGKYKEGYRTSDKQRGHSRRHAGFNARWDEMEKAEQCSGKRNKRSVWTVATKPFSEAHLLPSRRR